MGVQGSCGQPLIEENHFIFHMLPYEFFIWAGPIAYFGWLLFKSWLKACCPIGQITSKVSFKLCTWAFMYTKKIQVMSGIFHGYTTRKGCITILYHAIENCMWYSWIALIDGKVRWNTDEYATSFLQFDWLYFLWRGIKHSIKLWSM